MRRAAVLLLLLAGPGYAETRRALLVGINDYLPADSGAAKEWKPTALRPIPVLGPPARLEIPKLLGAVNDAQQMAQVLRERFGFQPENIRILTNADATAESILTTLKSFLVDSASKGDASLFYYAGHGTRIRNTKSDADSQLDSAILPADANRGVPDVRGKELARIYRLAVQKGVRMTVIQDSCFSGTGARGPLYSGITYRYVAPAEGRYVEDAFTDERGAKMEYPEDEGVLVLSASQDYQPAAELSRTDLNGAHGVFTWALLKVLWSVSADERVDAIFQRTRALVQTKVADQEPVMAGKGRPEMGLLGQPASSVRGRLIPVAGVQDGIVVLSGGYAMDLRNGSELKRYGSKEAPVEIKITAVTGVNSAEAKVSKAAPGASVQAGDLFQLDRWVMPDDEILRVYFPRPAPTMAEIRKVAAAFAPLRQSLGARWIDDPTLDAPDYVLSWNGRQWMLSDHRREIPQGAHPAAAAIAKALPGGAKFFLLLPPAKEMTPAIALGANTPNDAIRITPAGEHPDYVLLGRLAPAGGGVEYAWALPDLTASDLARQVAQARARKLPPPKNAMPPRSNWTPDAPSQEAGDTLTELALRLARVHAWIQLQPPVEAAEFPYHLALQNVATNEIKADGETFTGEKYRVILAADPKRLDAMAAEGVTQRWVYVFTVDSDGKSQLVFPRGPRGSVGNRMPPETPDQARPPSEILLTPPGQEIKIIPPYGVDTLYLLSSEERIPDPNVLSFTGARTRGMARGATPLSRLLQSVGNGTRAIVAEDGPIPLNWGIERHVFVSNEK